MAGMSFLEWFKMGGIFMWPLLIFSIIGLAYIIERSAVFLMVKIQPGMEIEDMFAKLDEKDVESAKKVLAKHKNAYITEVMAAGLDMLDQTIERMEKSMEACINIKIKILEKRLNMLVVISNLAPLTGFLGTVSGMINAFKSIAVAEEVSTQLVAAGIYEALITTVAGLVIAIVVVSAHSVFMNTVDNFINDSERLTNRLVEVLIEKKIK
ncbi:MAG: MotA/TolQ/ExbB proton channel family protein [Elusimicrobiota bacterium]